MMSLGGKPGNCGGWSSVVVLQVSPHEQAVVSIGSEFVVEPHDVGVMLDRIGTWEGEALGVEQVAAPARELGIG